MEREEQLRERVARALESTPILSLQADAAIAEMKAWLLSDEFVERFVTATHPAWPALAEKILSGENWTREHMVAVYGEAGADAMRKLSDAYAENKRLRSYVLQLSDEGKTWDAEEWLKLAREARALATPGGGEQPASPEGDEEARVARVTRVLEDRLDYWLPGGKGLRAGLPRLAREIVEATRG